MRCRKVRKFPISACGCNGQASDEDKFPTRLLSETGGHRNHGLLVFYCLAFEFRFDCASPGEQVANLKIVLIVRRLFARDLDDFAKTTPLLQEETMLNVERSLHEAIDKLPLSSAVYALCDLDNVPIYLSYASESLRIQVRRHLTEQVSNVEFCASVDPWEIAYVWIWSTDALSSEETDQLERYLAYQYGATGELATRTIPEFVPELSFNLPERICAQLLSDKVIQRRRKVENRLRMQASHFANLAYWCAEKGYLEILGTCDVHFRRLHRLYRSFRASLDD